MKKFNRKSQIVMRDSTGTFNVITKKHKGNQHEKKDIVYNVQEQELNYYPNSFNRNIQTKCLSGAIDNCQVFVLEEDKTYFLIFIKKVTLKNGDVFISGCTCDRDSDFIVLNETGMLYNRQEISRLIKCAHIKECIDLILERFSISNHLKTEDDMQNILLKHCTWVPTTSKFINEEATLYATLSSSDGILLFVLKNDKWRCHLCNFQVAYKCRHGQFLDIECYEQSYEYLDNELQEKQTSERFLLFSKKKFSGKLNKMVCFKFYLL